jgi:hypothetical protein
MLLEHMGRHIRDTGDPARAEKFFARAREIEKRAVRLQEMARENESLSDSNMEQPEN